ncbi:MAG: flagellar export chaperone FliS [Deltaproteobacteria bacterium]|nr:flagellar export chaperone FliS [Deltaproteobacteria bacterium]
MEPRKGARAYQKVAVVSASPGRILDDLFERAILECERARECIGNRDTSGKAKAVAKVIEIVSTLQAALDHSVVPAISQDLARLYGFVHEATIKGSARLDTASLEHAERILGILKSAFAEATEIVEKESR